MTGEPGMAEKRLAPWGLSCDRIGSNEVSVACQHRLGVLHHLSRDRDLHRGQSRTRRKIMLCRANRALLLAVAFAATLAVLRGTPMSAQTEIQDVHVTP